jgi:hypothetical protein
MTKNLGSILGDLVDSISGHPASADSVWTSN